MKLYTRTGDLGETAIIGGRVTKDDLRVEAYGTIDELNAFTAQAAWQAGQYAELHDLAQRLEFVMNQLFDCGSDLSYADELEPTYKLGAEDVTVLEQWIDFYQEQAPPIRQFVLPGGSGLAAALHVCRTVCRRAERRAVRLAAIRPCSPHVLVYLNRLSDFYFAAARAANARLNIEDVHYIPGLKADDLFS
ncbi:cob(I)yrinic acid a,c-diamide adenosyltransferase [Paenibacillus sp. SYP-B4298]|uniref:cob(I)yrinic acid a,c-diamide adenosyltransferase n=1 Tax=Paenibacillus sp. SYP-B4298 TaxID=2996034 RepID=UPI0022DE3D1B|nr:cob(I)yrinic acid a,c-diamide adenosyltransferase [Paenibacillus sp. SYP-B4298]